MDSSVPTATPGGPAFFRRHAVLWALLALQAVLSILLWLSGSLFGTFSLECAIGVTAYDLSHGLNPHVPLLDYYDRWTGGFFVAGVLSAPFSLILGDSPWALKLPALLVSWSVIGLGYSFLWRHVGAVAARVGAAFVTFCPPVLWYYAQLHGNYHYSELVFDLGAAVLVAELVLAGRRSLWLYGAAGLVGGLAIFNCFGSAPYLGVLLWLAWAFHREQLRGRRLLATTAGVVLGLLPFLLKLLWHTPYGRGTGADGHAKPYPTPAGWEAIAAKLGTFMPTDYPLNLGFQETLLPVFGVEPTLRLASLYASMTLAAVLGMLWLARGGLLCWLRATVPGQSGALSAEQRRDVAALVLPLFALAFFLAYLLSNQRIIALPPEHSQFRATRFLPPLIGLAALSVGPLVQYTMRALRPRRLSWVPLAGYLPLLALCALANVRTIDVEGLSASDGIPYRGRCTNVHGFYASPFLRGDHAGALQLCSGYDEPVRGDCFRGYVWGLGHYFDQQQLLSSPREEARFDEETIDLCSSVPVPWERDCYRAIGWSLSLRFLFAYDLVGSYCARLQEPHKVSWCTEGIGFYLGDHYGFAPWKFHYLMRPEETTRRQRLDAMAGVGYVLGHIYGRSEAGGRVCAQYGALDPAYAPACDEGRNTSAALGELSLPAWQDFR